jgi:hypothetical protein
LELYTSSTKKGLGSPFKLKSEIIDKINLQNDTSSLLLGRADSDNLAYEIFKNLVNVVSGLGRRFLCDDQRYTISPKSTRIGGRKT